MSLLDKQEVQAICEHTALRARKWSGFICNRASEDTNYHDFLFRAMRAFYYGDVIHSLTPGAHARSLRLL